MQNALFIRLDRMGDLVLTLPCDGRVSQNYQVYWAVPQGLEFAMEASRPQRLYRSFAKEFHWTQFKQFFAFVKKTKPQVSVSFHVPWWVNLALFLARVPVRGGVLSQWHSYLFLNKGLRQKRSQCEFHEMDYNYQLVEHSFDLTQQPDSWTPVELQAPTQLEPLIDPKENYVVVHPGMGGSALNWPTKHYAELIEGLTKNQKVVITGTKSDEAYLKPLKEKLKDNTQVVWLDKQLSGVQLLKLLSHSNATVAPSTGVIHLSASLGVPSFGIYSPIKVHRDQRWGPKGPKVQTFTPEVDCPAHFECLGKDCPNYYCMDQLKPQKILAAFSSALSGSKIQ